MEREETTRKPNKGEEYSSNYANKIVKTRTIDQHVNNKTDDDISDKNNQIMDYTTCQYIKSFTSICCVNSWLNYFYQQ